MVGDWLETTIGEQVTLQRGFDITKAEQHAGIVPVISSGGISSYHNKSAVQGPGVILGRKGVVGSVYYIKTDYWPHDTTLWVKDFHGNDPRFVYYFFKHMAPRIATMDVGSANPTLNRNHVHPIKTSWPQLDEQRVIAHILGSLDDMIDLNRRMNGTLEAIARTLFKSWFVDFDPVRAKAEGRDTFLPKYISKLFPENFQDSELGKIPKGWHVESFANTVQIIGGGTPKTSVLEYWDGDIPWFSVIDAPSDTDVFVVKTEKKITKAGLDNSSSQIMPEGTTIITARGTVGKTALLGVPMAMNQSCYGLQGSAGKRGFFTYYVTCNLILTLRQHSHGSVFDTITRDTLAGVDVVVPLLEVAEAFEDIITPLLDRILNNLFESNTLATIRNELLPKLLSGVIKVNDLERSIMTL